MGVDSLKRIERLERQARRYEEEISHLESIIDKLQIEHLEDISEREILLSRISELTCMLRKSEKLCEAKESFIQYRESQLLEFEDEIYNLKQRIAVLASQKKIIMADTHREPSHLKQKDNDQLIELVRGHSQRLVNRTQGHVPTFIAQNNTYRDEIIHAIELVNERLMLSILQDAQSYDLIVQEKELLEVTHDKLQEDFNTLQDDFNQVTDLYDKAKNADRINHERYIKNMDDIKQRCKQEKDKLKTEIKTWGERADYYRNKFEECIKEKEEIERNCLLEINKIKDDINIAKKYINDLGNLYNNSERERTRLNADNISQKERINELENELNRELIKRDHWRNRSNARDQNIRNLTEQIRIREVKIDTGNLRYGRLMVQVHALRIQLRWFRFRHMIPPINPPI